MFKLRRSLLLFVVLPFVLWSCTSAEEPPVVEPEPIVEEESAPAETMTEDDEMSEEDDSEMSESDETMAETVYIVDSAASTLTWTGAKAVGDSHTGTIDLIDGELIANGDEFISGLFTIDMTTIKDSGGNARLEGHLMSDDFFGVEAFPTATLEIVSATPIGNGEYDVTATLTMKDISDEITFPVTVDIADGTLSGTASIVFDRSLWDVRYGSGSFFSDLGDDIINDEINLEVDLVAGG